MPRYQLRVLRRVKNGTAPVETTHAWIDAVNGAWAIAQATRQAEAEPRRVSRRLLILRGWSHDEANPTLFP
jgi:hypothetical protein